MTRPLREITNDELSAAYARLGSVWLVAKELGQCGQSVHRRLKRAGVKVGNALSESDRETIREYYRSTRPDDFSLAALAGMLGRTRQFICRHAAEMGFTDRRRPQCVTRKLRAVATTKELWTRRPHPRGMAGKRHTKETLQKVGAASRRNWSTWKAFGIGKMSPESRDKMSRRMAIIAASVPAHKQYSRARAGRRPDLGETWFRSSWEANYARYLNMLIKMGAVESWAYEPETFWFDGIRRGAASYKPDFRVKYRNDPTPEYVELKGWVVAKDRTKWRRLAMYHPHIKLVVIKEKEYRAIAHKWASAIPNWETGRRVRLIPEGDL
jgi:hypothetical protein